MSYEPYKVREVVQHPDTNEPVFVRETRKVPILVRHPDTGEVVEAMPVDYERAEITALEHLVNETAGELANTKQQSGDEIEHAEKAKADAIRKYDQMIQAARDRVSEVESRYAGHKSELRVVHELVEPDADWDGDGPEAETEDGTDVSLENHPSLGERVPTFEANPTLDAQTV